MPARSRRRGRSSTRNTSIAERSRSRRDVRPIRAADVIVVGGGPAGLAAALVLARSRVALELYDSGHYRNARADALHGLPGLDGIAPASFRERVRADLARYGVEARRAEVDDARLTAAGPEVHVGNAWRVPRALLLATGVEDRLPAIEGAERFFGHGVHHCPYCDAFEWSERRLAALGNGRAGSGLAMLLRTTWGRDVTLLTDGPPRLTPGDRARLSQLGIPVERACIARLAGRTRLERVEFQDGRSRPVDALFFTTGQHQRSSLATKLGCAMNVRGTVRIGRYGESSIPGVWIAGDASPGPQLAAVAIAEGVMAGYGIHQVLHQRALDSIDAPARDVFDGGVRAPAGITLPRPGPGG